MKSFTLLLLLYFIQTDFYQQLHPHGGNKVPYVSAYGISLLSIEIYSNQVSLNLIIINQSLLVVG